MIKRKKSELIDIDASMEKIKAMLQEYNCEMQTDFYRITGIYDADEESTVDDFYNIYMGNFNNT